MKTLIIAGFAIAASLGLAGLAPVANASPTMSCAEANGWADAHNANSANVDTSSQAAVDAYNAEIDAIQAALEAACGE